MTKSIHQILLHVIFEYLGFYTKHTFQKINKNTNKIDIKNLYNIDQKYVMNFNDDILKKYKRVQKLDINHNRYITNMCHMTQLKELNMCGSIVRITNKDIINLTHLEKLDVNNNTCITDVNHMTKLKELIAFGFCGLDDKGIINLSNLEKLNSSLNLDIMNVNHMTRLRELYAGGTSCGISDIGIMNLTNLEILNANYNASIKNVNHMTKL